MGNALNRRDSTQRMRSMRTAAKTVGAFARHTNYEQREGARVELRRAIQELTLTLKQDYEEVQRKWDSHLDFASDSKCTLCGGDESKGTLFPCRVCSHVFHESCLQRCTQCSPIYLRLLHRATTNTGWSCYICGDLTRLLSEPDVETLQSAFHRFDKDHDRKLSWTEFLELQSEAHEGRDGGSLSEEEEQRLWLEFRLADTDQSGALDWQEFGNHEAKGLLLKYPQDKLVSMLSEKELLVARNLFRTVDKNNDGVLQKYEAEEAIKDWFERVDASGGRKSPSPRDPMRALHISLNSKLILEGSDWEDRPEGVTWEDFIRSQALIIISVRPNQTAINGH